MLTSKKSGRHLFGGDAFALTFHVAGDLATGDGQVQVVAPFDLTIVHAQMFISANGGNSGNTDIMISVGAVDYHAAASGRIAHDSSALYKVITLTTKTVDAGGVIEIDIDAVPPDTAPTDLTVTLFCERRIVSA